VQLVSKISNLCDPDPPTSQTDRRTTCNLNTALCTSASRGKNVSDGFYRTGLISGFNPDMSGNNKSERVIGR